MMHKTHLKIIFSVIISASTVFSISSLFVSAAHIVNQQDVAKLEDIKASAQLPCSTTKTFLEKWRDDFNTGTKYNNIRTGVTNGQFTLVAVLPPLIKKINTEFVKLQNLCNTVQNYHDLWDSFGGQTDPNNAVASFRAVLPSIEALSLSVNGLNPLFNAMVSLENLYAKAHNLGDDKDQMDIMMAEDIFSGYLHVLTFNPFLITDELNDNGKVIFGALSAINANIKKTNEDMPGSIFYTSVVSKNAAGISVDVSTLMKKISSNLTLLSASSRMVSEVSKTEIKVFTLAAKDGIAPESVNTLLRAKYSPLYDDYKLRAKKSCDSLKKNIGAIKPRLVSNSESIEAAYPSVSAATKTSLKEQMNSKIASLDALTAAVGAECAVSFNFVNGKTGEFNALNLSRVMLPVISSLKAFDKHIAGANKLNTFYNTWNNSQDQLDGALTGQDNPNKLDRVDFSKFGMEIVGAYPTALEPLVTARKTEVESSLLATATSGKVEDLKITKTKVSAYSKDLGTARKQFGDFQKRWWQFINQAAVEGIVKNLESDLPALKDEVRAAKLFQDFNKRRESYYAQAKKIVETRTGTVTKKQAKVDAATYVPGEVKSALAFKTKTDTFLATLARYLNEVILVQNNYFDLRASLVGSPEFIGLKNFGVNNYTRAQDTYVRLDKDYQKAAILEGILNGEVVKTNLSERITALESNTGKATEAQGLRSTYNGILASISDYRSKMNTFITTELANVLTDPDNNDLYLTMRTKEKEVRLVYGTLVSQVKILTTDIRTLEKKP